MDKRRLLYAPKAQRDLARRLREHRAGRSSATRHRQPVEVVRTVSKYRAYVAFDRLRPPGLVQAVADVSGRPP